MIRLVFPVLFALIGAAPGLAEIERIAAPTDGGFQFYWWPKLVAADGWHHDPEVSRRTQSNMLLPDGASFSDAETVIYARAIYRKAEDQHESLDELIHHDMAKFRSRDPEMKISEAEAVTLADGSELVSYEFVPDKGMNWERVAYGEDGDFFLIFVLSSRSERGYAESTGAFEQIVSSYTREP